MFQWCNALFISIFELNMMVKIGVIFMPFSNPTCHFRATADFTVCTVCTWCKVSCSSEMYSRKIRTHWKEAGPFGNPLLLVKPVERCIVNHFLEKELLSNYINKERKKYQVVTHHSKMLKDGWAKYIPFFAFKWW